MSVTVEIGMIRRAVDQCPCDWCGTPIRLDDRQYVCIALGTSYCSRHCAQEDVTYRAACIRTRRIENNQV